VLLAVCKIRGRDGGCEAEQDHTPCVYIYICAIPPLCRTSGTSRDTIPLFLLSASTAPLLSAVPPDSFFHARLRLRLRSTCGSVLLWAVSVSPIVPADFHRQTAELFIAHVPGYRNRRMILASPPRGERGEKMNDARARCVCEIRRVRVAIGWIGRFFILVDDQANGAFS